MVRLADLSENERKRALGRIKDLPEFKGRAWVTGPPLNKRRLAIITTSGIHRHGDTPFSDGDAAAESRVIPGTVRGFALAGLTGLLVRRRRTRPLPRRRGHRNDPDLADPRTHRGDQSAARVVGALHHGASAGCAGRRPVPAPCAAGRAEVAGGAGGTGARGLFGGRTRGCR